LGLILAGFGIFSGDKLRNVAYNRFYVLGDFFNHFYSIHLSDKLKSCYDLPLPKLYEVICSAPYDFPILPLDQNTSGSFPL